MKIFEIAKLEYNYQIIIYQCVPLKLGIEAEETYIEYDFGEIERDI